MNNSYHHGDLKDELFKAAKYILKDKGVESLSLRNIAKRVGVSHTAPYRHFASKEELLYQLSVYGFEKLRFALLDKIKEKNNQPLEQLELLAEAYVSFICGEPQLAQLMFTTISQTAQPPDYVCNASDEAKDVLTQTLMRGQKMGLIKALDIKIISLSAWSIVHGLSLLCLGGLLPELNSDQLRIQTSQQVSKILLSGIATKQNNSN